MAGMEAKLVFNGVDGLHLMSGKRRGQSSWTSNWSEKNDLMMHVDKKGRQAMRVAQTLADTEALLLKRRPRRCTKCWRPCEKNVSTCVCDLLETIRRGLPTLSPVAGGSTLGYGSNSEGKESGAGLRSLSKPLSNPFHVIRSITLLYHFREVHRSSNSGSVVRRLFPEQTQCFVKVR